MVIHQIRNATLVIEMDGKFILVDPMLGKKGSGVPYSFVRFKVARNPLVDLVEGAQETIGKTTHCLITHLHGDHLDKAGIDFLKDRAIPVFCSKADESKLRKKGLNVAGVVSYWEPCAFLGGEITGVPAIHGYDFTAKLMGNVSGYFISLPGQKSIYLSSDTVFTKHIKRVFKDFKPDISVLAAGTAQLDIGKPILMDMEDIIKFVRKAPGNVIANHMDVLNHCATSRNLLKKELTKHRLIEKVFIPEDGKSIQI